MIEQMIAELKIESERTKDLLESIPEDKLSWQPHPKSLSAGALARHIATIPLEILEVFKSESFDVSNMDPSFAPCKSCGEIIDLFNSCLREGITTIQSWDEDFIIQEWKLTKGEQTLVVMPRIMGLRRFLLNHLYHHRGQLSVYLRLLDVPVPSVYGPTADINPFA